MDMQNGIMTDILSEMLSTQLLAADVYATYVRHSDGMERGLWMRMLNEELAHVRLVMMMLEEGAPLPVEITDVKLDAFRETAERALSVAEDSAFERTLWALRLEHAEIDFGLEAMASDSLLDNPDSPVLPVPISIHYNALLEWALRYKGAREIAIQIARIEEHIPHIENNNSRINS